jgi:hypothetical protein
VTAGVVALSAIAMAAFVATSDADTLAWGAPDGGDLGLDVWRLIGWSPVPAALAAVGLFVLVTGRLDGASTWKAVLLGAWLGIPLAAGLLFSLARSSFEPGYAVSATPALALLAAAGVVAQRRELALGLAALLGVSAVATVSVWYAAPSEEDWRAAIATIRAEQRAGEAVVVLPARQRVAADYYAGAGYGVTHPRGRRVWLLLAEDDGARRLRLGRKLVRPPRYALLEERRFGDRLWLQVWAVP